MNWKALRNNHYPVMRSRDLNTTPVSRKLLGTSIVLFRAQGGKVAAFLDRCPHRGARLSEGSVCKNGNIRCPYHGWAFDAEGRCTSIPSAAKEKPMSFPSMVLSCFEKEGAIFVSLEREGSRVSNPWHTPDWEHSDFLLENRVKADFRYVLENFVDAAHTAWVHTGLFRSKAKNLVEASITHLEDGGVRISTTGEKQNPSLLARLFGMTEGEVFHQDLYAPPCSVVVDYQFGKQKVRSISVCTPENESETRIFTKVYHSRQENPLFHRIKNRLTKEITQLVLKQDKKILEEQHEGIAEFGEKGFAATESDAPVMHVHKAIQNLLRGNKGLSGKEVRVKYYL